MGEVSRGDPQVALQALPWVMLDIVGRVWSWDPGEDRGKGEGAAGNCIRVMLEEAKLGFV